MKAYEAPGVNSATFWEDTKTTYLGIWPRFLGLPDYQASLFGGLQAPVYAELSGIIMFTTAASYEIMLHCQGWCSLYIYGKRFPATRHRLPVSQLIICPKYACLNRWNGIHSAGELVAESPQAAQYTDASSFKVAILTPGVFPYRILYQQEEGKMGIGLRWQLEAADGSLSTFSDIPGSRLFTDAYMHDSDSEALTGSIAGKPLARVR